jgi:hypothetical protein
MSRAERVVQVVVCLPRKYCQKKKRKKRKKNF